VRVVAGDGARVEAEYVAVGHVTTDVAEDGAETPGGTALFSALYAARAGLATAIVTRGDPAALRAALDGFADDVDVWVQPAEHGSRLLTVHDDAGRRQQLLAWAGPIEPVALAAGVVHLGPVARELDGRWMTRGGERKQGLTPQGLVRRWGETGWMGHADEPDDAAGSADVIVVSEVEAPFCPQLLASARARGAVVVVTRGARPATVSAPDFSGDVPARTSEGGNDLGAGDVFTAALLLELDRGAGTEDAMRFAHAAAARHFGGSGADAVPHADDVRASL
jgi:sugar/nucleoside kinase (ribokinase family)